MSDKEQEVETEVISETEEKAVGVVETNDGVNGFKDQAHNPDVLADSENNESIVGKPKAPLFFVKKSDRSIIEVDVLTNPLTGKIVSVSRANIGIDFDNFKILKRTTLRFEFAIPSYQDIVMHRQRSSVWQAEVQRKVVDVIKFRNSLLVWCLKDWNLTDEKEEKIVLTFDDDGCLSDSSMTIIGSVCPSIIDVVLTNFEKDVLI